MALKLPTKQFPHLDGLRAIAALLVILYHTGYLIQSQGGSSVFANIFSRSAEYGVNLFFCLSGFLITYLLIKEAKETGNISVKKFYFRRILRIWPLYFFAGLVGVLILPFARDFLANFVGFSFSPYLANLFFLFTFSVNFQVMFGFADHFTVQSLWSIAIEEQFYLIWAPILSLFKKHLNILIFCIFLIGLAANLYLGGDYYYNSLARVLNFAVGGFIAVHLYRFQNTRFFSSIFLWLFAIFSAIILNSSYLIELLHLWHYVNIFGCFSTGAIIILFTGIKPAISLNNAAMSFLGSISYGLYIYHPLCGRFADHLLRQFFSYTNALFPISFILLTIATTVIVSAVSYFTLERFFLKYKYRFK
jgi:peptidoglycan/LPS O-acetylase OafA/YrhL